MRRSPRLDHSQKAEKVRSGHFPGHSNTSPSACAPGVGPARLDVDVNLLPGKAIAEIRSPAIPGIKLPGKKVSDWNMVVNMGSGEAYYFNKKTGTTTYEAPF